MVAGKAIISTRPVLTNPRHFRSAGLSASQFSYDPPLCEASGQHKS